MEPGWEVLNVTETEWFLMKDQPDPTTPAVGQRWQARATGKVRRIDRFEYDGQLAHFAPGQANFIDTEDLRTCWRCVDHVPERFLKVNGRWIESWREMAIAMEQELVTHASARRTEDG